MKTEYLYLAVPMGDPAGIGPEIVLDMLADDSIPGKAGIVYVADRNLVVLTAKTLSKPMRFDRVVSSDPELEAAMGEGARIILYDLPRVDPVRFSFGKIQADCGKAAYDCVEQCVRLVQSGFGQAIVTPPLHKEALKQAGVPYIGYTEILSALGGSSSAVTMFDTLGMKIFFHTRHLSLVDACRAVTAESLLATILRCNEISLSEGSFDTRLPLVVAGLNPHCGEHGLFGNEEQIAIDPAIAEARAQGVDVVGPVGADSVFYQTRMGKYRAAISLYHDQGHIAAKTLDFNQTISVTWGLPFLRTSVDHGTAFDIAGKGVADSRGMARAVLVAFEYLVARNPDLQKESL
jgi:4-hydroxythreonine-4-phosphate dehydrogenase